MDADVALLVAPQAGVHRDVALPVGAEAALHTMNGYNGYIVSIIEENWRMNCNQTSNLFICC